MTSDQPKPIPPYPLTREGGVRFIDDNDVGRAFEAVTKDVIDADVYTLKPLQWVDMADMSMAVIPYGLFHAFADGSWVLLSGGQALSRGQSGDSLNRAKEGAWAEHVERMGMWVEPVQVDLCK